MATITIGYPRRDGKVPVALTFPGSPNAFGGFYPSRTFRHLWTPDKVRAELNHNLSWEVIGGGAYISKCPACGSRKPTDQSCGCFDNGSE